MNMVNWDLADTYCRLVGKRLPTEAEWTYAASGGGRFVYPWGNATDFQACTNGLTTCAAKSFPASTLGIYDLDGNVMEWVTDPNCDPKALGRCGTDPWRKVKGGSWDSKKLDDLKAKAKAQGWEAKTADPRIGFRCAASPLPR